MRHRRLDQALLDRLWPAACFASDLDFSRRTGAVITALHEARHADDRDQAQQFFDALDSARAVWTAEPQASILDHFYAQGAYYFAEWASCQHDYEQCLDMAGLGWRVLDAKLARRTRLGLPPAYSSSVRLQLLTAASDAKWRLGPEAKDRVLPVEEHASCYCRLSAAVREARAARALSPLDVDSQAIVALWAGLWVAAACVVHSPAAVPAVLAEANRWHRELYGADGFALQGMELAEPPDHVWYWHFEIVKAWAALQVGDSAAGKGLGRLYDGLLGAARRWPLAAGDQPYLDSIARDRAWMQGELKRSRLAVVG